MLDTTDAASKDASPVSSSQMKENVFGSQKIVEGLQQVKGELPQKRFAKLIIKHFPELKKEEYLMDLYDYLSVSLATEVSFEAILTYFHS